MVRLKAVVQGNGTHEDAQGRLAARKSNYTKIVTINPSQVVAVEPMPSTIVESEGESPVALTRVSTTNGVYFVLGSHSVVESLLFQENRRILKG